MAKSFYEYTTKRGNQVWGRWVCVHDDVRSNIIEFCKRAFNGKYSEFEIEPIYFNDRYFNDTATFFPEVGVRLHKSGTEIYVVIKAKKSWHIFDSGYTEKITSIKEVDSFKRKVGSDT